MDGVLAPGPESGARAGDARLNVGMQPYGLATFEIVVSSVPTVMSAPERMPPNGRNGAV